MRVTVYLELPPQAEIARLPAIPTRRFSRRTICPNFSELTECEVWLNSELSPLVALKLGTTAAHVLIERKPKPEFWWAETREYPAIYWRAR